MSAGTARNREATPVPRANDKQEQEVASSKPKESVWKHLLPLLTEEGLQNIQSHKYKPGVYTPLDNLFNPIWDKLTNFLPMWFAPNLVTLSGFIPMAISFSVVWLHQPDFSTPVPPWLVYFTGIGLLFYQTFDAMDGKQARRTGSSSPIGQLFDHGCDCLACYSHHSMAAMVFMPGPSRWGFYGFSVLFTGFFLAQWQEHYTGILCTSFGPVGTTETQYGLIALALFAGSLGPDAVVQLFVKTAASVPWSSVQLPVGIICIQAWVVFVLVLMGISIKKTVVEAVAVGKLSTCLLELSPIIALNVVFAFWNPESYAAAPRMVCFLTGLLFFYYTAQMILFSMAKMAYPICQFTLVPFVALAVHSRYARKDDSQCFCEVFSIAMCIWIAIWLLRIVHQLKRHLRINIFSIKTKDV